MTGWLAIGAGAGALIAVAGALAILWKAARFLADMSRLRPVIVAIAEQFKTNTGSSLKDQINRLERLAESSETAAANALQAATLSRQVSTHQTAVLESLLGQVMRMAAVADQVSRLEERFTHLETGLRIPQRSS